MDGKKQVFTWILWSTWMLMLGMTTEAFSQGYGSFVDAPRNSTAVSAFSPSAQRLRLLPDNTPAAVQTTLRKLDSLRSNVIASKLTLNELHTKLNRLQIPTILDFSSLEDEAVSPEDDIVDVPAANLTLGQALKYALEHSGCTWTLDTSGNLLILSNVAAEELLMTVSYDVTELVTYGDNDALINLITATVQPDSWDEVGGPGTVLPAPPGRRDLLVVSNSFHVQRETQQLLNSLARMSTSSSVSLPGALPRGPRIRSRTSVVPRPLGSSVISMPHQSKKRGIGLPNHTGDGTTGGFVGGMAGGMF